MAFRRAAQCRVDEGFLRESLASARVWPRSAAGHFCFFPAGDGEAVVPLHASWSSLRDRVDDEPVFLGIDEEGPLFAVGLRENDVEPVKVLSREGEPLLVSLGVPSSEGKHEASVSLLRSRLDQVGADAAEALLMANALLNWASVCRWCGRCGGVVVGRTGGHTRKCGQCGLVMFPRLDPAVLALVLDASGQRAILGRNRAWPERRYSALAGFVEVGESLEACVAREVEEEVGLAVQDLQYAGSQAWPFPGSLMVAYFCRARDESAEPKVNVEELADARWFSRDQVGEVLLPPPSALSHRLIAAWLNDTIPPGPRLPN